LSTGDGGWVPCDGRAFVRDDGVLFAQIGTTYGAPTPTTYCVPDLRGRAIIGEGTSAWGSTYTRGQQVGTPEVTLTAANLPAHTHPFDSSTTDVAGALAPASFNTMQPSLVMNVSLQDDDAIFASVGNNTGHDGYAFDPADPFVGQIHILAATPRTDYGAIRADGSTVSIATHTALFAIMGTYYGGNGFSTLGRPDLRGKLAIGADGNDGPGPGLTPRAIADATGESAVTLYAGNLPTHTHTTPSGDTGQACSGLGFDNMQPSLALQYCIAIQGVYPTSGGMSDFVGYLGEIVIFTGNFVPAGYVRCDGRALPVTGNEALYSVMSTTYGTAGPGTFRIPDLRGRTPVGPSAAFPNATSFGTEVSTMSIAQMPAHVHGYTPPCPGDVGVQGGLPGRDGIRDNNDFIVFINDFFAGNFAADFGRQGGLHGPDGQLDNNDFIVFIDEFFAVCS
jgi:microcystin-dependent protein